MFTQFRSKGFQALSTEVFSVASGDRLRASCWEVGAPVDRPISPILQSERCRVVHSLQQHDRAVLSAEGEHPVEQHQRMRFRAELSSLAGHRERNDGARTVSADDKWLVEVQAQDLG